MKSSTKDTDDYIEFHWRLWIHPVLVTISTMSNGKDTFFSATKEGERGVWLIGMQVAVGVTCNVANLSHIHAAFKRLWDIWNDNTTTSLQKNHVSSVILDSVITVFMPCCTLLLLLVMRKWNHPIPTINTCIKHLSNSLREIDIELMRRLSPRVNVIPVVGRADSLTPQELQDFKKRVMLFWSWRWFELV